MLRCAVHTWAALLQVISALDETAPRLVLLASKPYSGSHLTRRIMEAASDQCTLSVYPEGVSLGPRQHVVAAARSLDRYQTTLSLSIDNERERKKAGFPPCEPPTGWYLVKTHNDQTTKPPGDLFGHAFRSVKVFRLARNPFDNVMREILGDARSREKLLAPVGEAAAARPADAKRAARLASGPRAYARYHAFWDRYAPPADQLVVRYETLCLRPAATADRLLAFVFGGAAPLNGTRLRAALAREARAVPDAAGQVGKESVRLRHRVFKDDGRAVFDGQTFAAIERGARDAIANFGYGALARTFGAIVAGDATVSDIDADPAGLLEAPASALDVV